MLRAERRTQIGGDLLELVWVRTRRQRTRNSQAPRSTEPLPCNKAERATDARLEQALPLTMEHSVEMSAKNHHSDGT